jgi:hypothetical protein
MSDQENTQREDEDVEAHKKSKVMANDEAPKDDESDDDVELHRKRQTM